MLCLAWSNKALESFPSTENNKMNHNLKKKKKKVSNGSGPQKGHRDTGAAALPAVPRAYRDKGSPHVSCPLHWSHLDPKAPNSAQAPTPCPLEGRGGPQEPVLRPAGSAGRRRGARRTGRPPWGGSPGSQAWQGLQIQTPGAGRQRSALDCPFPFFFQARTLKPYLGPVLTKHGGGAT